jgi:FkbM family methyltransferase
MSMKGLSYSMFDRLAGLARSIAIYHAIPFRQRRLRQLYRRFVSRGDLVIDVGAHAGNHVRALAALGCRVVAIEPQPDFARVLRLLFRRSPHVTILETAVSDRSGRAELSISERTPTVTSLASDWRDARAGETDFAQVRWNRRIEIAVTTLDALAAEYGAPAFIKLDVEGSEPSALAGLSHPVPALAFEYLPRALDRVEACVARLRTLDRYVYNWSPGESYRFASAAWLEGPQLLDALRGRDGQRRSGDVYARRNVDVTDDET